MQRTRSHCPALALALVLVCGCAGTPQAAVRHDGPDARGAAASVRSGQRLLTLEDVSDPEKRLDFDGDPLTGLEWLDGAHWLQREDGEGAENEWGTRWLVVDARSGAQSVLLDSARLAAALAGLEGIDAERVARHARPLWSAAHDALVLALDGQLAFWRLDQPAARWLTRGESTDELPTLSPDGAHVAFVRENDLWVVDTRGGAPRALTAGGGENLLHGKLDWLYQEEVYGRGEFQGYWWSPDGKRLAYLTLDESEVPRYTVVDDRPTPPKLRVFPYPKAGAPNPVASLSIVDVGDGDGEGAGAATRTLDLASLADAQPLLVRVAWAPDSATLAFQVQDREQRWLELCFADPATGAWRRVLRETTPAWVDVLGNPRWLADGSFLWFSERDGWKHLWRYAPDGSELARLTKGEFETREIVGVDEERGWVYLSTTIANPIGEDLCRVKLDGTGFERLSDGRGTHAGQLSPDGSLLLDTWSALDTPPQVFLLDAQGRRVRTVDENRVPLLAELALQPIERHSVPTRDGFEMEALLIRPRGFDATKRWPVCQHLYAGPHAPMVRDRWAGRRGMYWQLLAQQGIAVWVCDNRSASGKGAVSAWPVYQRLVESELADVEDGLDWLEAQGWVDPARIAVHGWSFGGLMTCYALTHSKRFAAGIAGGSVTDWLNYDTVYTERYMRLPSENPEGYRRTAPRLAAADLHGELLLIHGTMDDNVHPQNTLQLAYALQKAGKPFEMMLYPGSEHGVVDPALSHHLNLTMLAFLRRTLLGDCGRAEP